MLRAVLDCHVYVGGLIRPEGPPGRIVDRAALADDVGVTPSSHEIRRSASNPEDD